MTKVRKAVFPAAGLGTRFLPVTKSVPKEILPIFDRPAIHVVMQEAVDAGIEEVLLITGRQKTELEDYFDCSPELEAELEKKGKTEELELVRAIPDMIRIHSVRQKRPLGLGHAVLCGEAFVGDEPFAVFLPDDIIYTEKRNAIGQMIDAYQDTGGSILALQRVAPEKVSSYGIVAGEEIGPRRTKVSAMVEKPAPDEAPSNLGIVGRYVLTPSIFALLHNTDRGSGGEIQLTDAIAEQIGSDEGVYGVEFEGRRFDTGDPVGYLEAVIGYALKSGDESRVREMIAGLLAE